MSQRKPRPIWWTIAGSATLACAIQLDAEGEDKACTASGRCATGYSCNSQWRCVRGATESGGAPGADAGGGSDGGGQAGAAPESGGQAGAAPQSGGQAGTGGQGASGGSGGAGTGGSGMTDAGMDPPDASCSMPVEWFPDDDRDGHGRSDGSVLACSAPGARWAIVGGDCNDDDNQVFPGQTTYFETAYPAAVGDSFDYDCSETEDPDPEQPDGDPACSSKTVLNCSGSGFAVTGRRGSGMNPLCGSTALLRCMATTLACGEGISTVPAKRCR
jgi:hypothetical protein